MTIVPDHVAKRMQELSVRFRDRAHEDHDALLDAREAGDLIAMRDIAHRLAGLAPMFGFDAIGETARRLEDAVDGNADPAQLVRDGDALILLLAGVERV